MRIEISEKEYGLGTPVRHLTGYLPHGCAIRKMLVLIDAPTDRRMITANWVIKDGESELTEDGKSVTPEEMATQYKQWIKQARLEAETNSKDYGNIPVSLSLELDGKVVYISATSLPFELQPEHLRIIVPWDMVA